MPIPSLANLLQARFRQVLALRGGPLVTASDFVQPTVALGNAEGPFRNPALEVGDGIGRQFTARGTAANAALTFSTVRLQTFNGSRQLLHVRRIVVNFDGTKCPLQIGLVSNPALNNEVRGSAQYRDARLGLNDVGSAAGPIDITGGDRAALTINGFLELQAAALNSANFIDVDYVLAPGDLLGISIALVVHATTVNTQFRAQFDGQVYDFGPGAR